MKVPDRITVEWINSLSNENLLAVELLLRHQFQKLEQAEKKARGRDYDLMRGPAELMGAWDRWSRVSTFSRARHLNPARE